MKYPENHIPQFEKAGFHTLKAADFPNAHGENIVSLQMILSDNGRAYAVADFRDRKMERFDCVGGCIEVGREWLEMQIYLMSL